MLKRSGIETNAQQKNSHLPNNFKGQGIISSISRTDFIHETLYFKTCTRRISGMLP